MHNLMCCEFSNADGKTTTKPTKSQSVQQLALIPQNVASECEELRDECQLLQRKFEKLLIGLFLVAAAV